MDLLRSGRTRWLLLGLALALIPGVAMAQTESGKIVGAVVDQSGAVLPGATVNLKSVASGSTRSLVTDANGGFTFAALQPGVYEVKIELTGFNKRDLRVTVPVGSTVTVDAKLEVGGQAEQITVVAESGVTVNTATQDIQTTVSEQQIRELPTITRNPYALVALSGNVNNSAGLEGGSTGRGADGFAINGQRPASTNILLDGAANNDEFGAAVGQDVPLDSVQEFSIITSNFSAQFGRASGGIVNVATKSGTNDFKGTVYEFFRSNKLATQTYEDKARENEESEFKRHQMGFSVGGPIIKDKLHFFSSLEYIRVRSEAQLTRLVVTPEFLARTSPATQAFFSGYDLAATPTGTVITRGEIGGLVPGGPFSQLPADLPIFQEVVQTVPSDAGGGDPRNDYQFVGRLDWNVGPNTTAYARVAYQDQKFFDGSNANSPYQGFNTGTINKNLNLLGSATHIWSPKFTSQTKVVFNRLRNEQPLGDQPAGPTLYMRTTVTTLNGLRIAFPGYLPFNPGSAIPFGGPQKLYQFYQDMNYVTGKHDVRFGGSFVRINDDRTFGAYQNSVETLGANVGAALDNLVRGQLIAFQTAVDPQGKFPGQVVSLPVGQPSFTRNNHYNEFALYFNDTWSLTDRLKLNLGVRYEYFGVQENADPRLDSNFYYGTGNSVFEQIRNGSIQIAEDSAIGGLWKADKNNFAPRVGFAWDVNGDGKMSVRGGYGIGFERNFGNVTFNVIQNPPAYAVIALTAPADVPVLNITTDNVGPLAGTGSKVLPATSARWVDPEIVNAYAHFWSLSFQRELWSNTVGSVEYTGSKGADLYSIEDPSRIGTGAVYLGDASTSTRLNRQYTALNRRSNGGRSTYNGFTFSLDTRKVGNTGLALTGRYTLGWTKDNLSSTFSESFNNFNLGLLDPYNPDLDYGYADFDVRHRFVGSGIWEIPLAKDATGAKKALLNGWQFTFLLTAQSGAPFTIFDCTNGITVCARLALQGGLAGYTDESTGDPNNFNYLDISNQAAGVGSIANATTGTTEVWAGVDTSNMAERNSFRRPGRWNVDAILAKRFRFGDRTALQLRLEAYNLFNHANLFVNDAEADISATTQITAFRGDRGDGNTPVGDGQRRLQIAAKFEF